MGICQLPNLSSRIVKDALIAMIHEFTFLCNLSISTGIVPDEWKEAIVFPIPKTQNSKSVSDLRPISLLPIPGKVLEHIIHDSLMIHLESSKILSHRQFGFRPGMSTAILFIIYVNDLPLTSKFSKIFMYAGDTVLYMPIHRHFPSASFSNYQLDLNNIAEWSLPINCL